MAGLATSIEVVYYDRIENRTAPNSKVEWNAQAFEGIEAKYNVQDFDAANDQSS